MKGLVPAIPRGGGIVGAGRAGGAYDLADVVDGVEPAEAEALHQEIADGGRFRRPGDDGSAGGGELHEANVDALRLSLSAANGVVSGILPIVEAAQVAVNAAQSAVNSLNSSISYHSSRASSYYSAYKSWKRK